MQQVNEQQRNLEAAVIRLFELNTLLHNEYMLKRFMPDPYNTNQIYIEYDPVQRENSLCSSYLFTDEASVRNYHQALQEILTKYSGKLWIYDSQFQTIRPYYPRERKTVMVKVQQFKADTCKKFCEEFGGVASVNEQLYAADKNYVKLYIRAESEEVANALFQKLMVRKEEFLIDVVKMETIDYLQEFYQRYYQRMAEIHQKYLRRQQGYQNGQPRPPKRDFYHHQQRDQPAHQQREQLAQSKGSPGNYHLQKKHPQQPKALSEDQFPTLK